MENGENPQNTSLALEDISAQLNPKELQQISYSKWLDDGHRNNEILYTHDFLTKKTDNVVYDLGGYEGLWTERVLNKYSDHIESLVIYEPISRYFDLLTNKFRDNDKIQIEPYRAYDKYGTSKIYLGDAGSSAHIKKEGYNGEYEIAASVDFGAYFRVKHFNGIDLLKINIEGDEFKVIDSLYMWGSLSTIDQILIQTHPYGENPYEDYTRLSKQLSKTHECIWWYPFIWELWRRK